MTTTIPTRVVQHLLVIVVMLLTTTSTNVVVDAAKQLQNLQVTLRGHKYDISGVETVQDVQVELQQKSGVTPKQQGRVLFGGKRLSSSSTLQDAGVTDGDTLNLVPGKAKSTTTSSNSKQSPSSSSATSSSSSSTSSDNDSSNMGSQWNELLKGMGGSSAASSGGDGTSAPAPTMEESLKMMGDMMNSPIFQEFMDDPEKLEQSRRMILDNPLLKGMMAGMPGMDELLNDPVAWREAMQAAANLYKNMDPNDLIKAMMGDGDDNVAGNVGGLFDGQLDTSTTSSSTSSMAAALDELSEGED